RELLNGKVEYFDLVDMYGIMSAALDGSTLWLGFGHSSESHRDVLGETLRVDQSSGFSSLSWKGGGFIGLSLWGQVENGKVPVSVYGISEGLGELHPQVVVAAVEEYCKLLAHYGFEQAVVAPPRE
ncbi:MAG TPA: hypothetical protein VGE59_04530, partial [Patescibacteria group bacterium]